MEERNKRTLQLDKDIIPGYVRSVMATLISCGYETYIAGGAVRDSIIGRESNDWDLATAATPTQIQEVFESMETCKAIDTGSTYGTITVKYDDCDGVEVTTFRLDSEEGDGRRPKNVKFTLDPYEDVVRRDFTMNGLFMTGGGEVIDWVDGIEDIHNKLVRAIGYPIQRFRQDKLRLMRMVRQAMVLDFEIDQNTWFDCLGVCHLVKDCSGSAIRKEFEKVLVHDKVRRGLELFHKSGLLRHFLPEVDCMYGYDQMNPHHMRDLWDHTVTAMECVPNTVPLRLAALLHDTGKMNSREFGDDGVAHYNKHHLDSEVHARNICKRLDYDNAMIDKIALLCREHMSKHWTMPDSGIRRFIKRVGEDNLEELFQLQLADAIAARPPYLLKQWYAFQDRVRAIVEAQEPMLVTDLAINGHDLMAIGFKGKQIGEAQNYLLDIVLDDPEMNTREDLLERAGNRYADVENWL